MFNPIVWIAGCVLLAFMELTGIGDWSWALLITALSGIVVEFLEGNKPTRRRKRIDRHIRNKRKYGWKKAYEILQQETENNNG